MISRARHFIVTSIVISAVLLGFSAVSVRSGEPDELREKAHALMKQAERLANSGQLDEADEVERGAQKLLQNARRIDQDTGKKPSVKKPGAKSAEPGSPHETDFPKQEKRKQPKEGEARNENYGRPEIELRMTQIKHIQIAVQNLKAAGLHDLARASAERAEQMQRELQEIQRHHSPKGSVHFERRDDGIEDLRHEIRQMREELNALRELLPRPRLFPTPDSPERRPREERTLEDPPPQRPRPTTPTPVDEPDKFRPRTDPILPTY